MLRPGHAHLRIKLPPAVARLYLHVNSLSVESVSAVRVSLRELVSAAIVHKRERVQGVMRV